MYSFLYRNLTSRFVLHSISKSIIDKKHCITYVEPKLRNFFHDPGLKEKIKMILSPKLIVG